MPHPEQEHSLRIQLATALRERDESRQQTEKWLRVVEKLRENLNVTLLERDALKEALAAARRECGVVKALLREWNPRLCARKPWPRVGTPSACGQCLGCRTLAVVGATVETSP